MGFSEGFKSIFRLFISNLYKVGNSFPHFGDSGKEVRKIISGGYSQVMMLDYLSKQISAVGGIALVACSLSGEGLLSKGVIFTSLFSSNEPEFENLDALFEDLC